MGRQKKKTKKVLGLVTIIVAVLVFGLGAYLVNYSLNNFDIKIIGDKDIKIGLNGVYDEKGASAKILGIDVSHKIKISGKVDTSKPGTYTVKYKVKSLSATRKVTVGDKMNPEVTLKGDDNLTVKLGEEFNEPGYTAKDDNGNDLTSKVEVNTDGLNKAGKQEITYTVKDSKGNATRLSRTVNVQQNTNYETPGLPICMFHYVYDENDPPEDLHKRYGNYISVQALSEELEWLNSEGYYYPTWDEVRDYVDGKLILPEKSIVITFDDGTKNFMELGIPVLEKYKVPATSFVITKNDGEKKVAKYKSDYVSFQSHSHNMHRPGGNIGHGGIFTALSEEDALADLKMSTDIVGNNDAFAYPYGDYTDQTALILEKAGFKCAVTTQPGKARPGDNPYLLPRQRMSLGQSLTQFQNKVRPASTKTSSSEANSSETNSTEVNSSETTN